MEQVFFLRLFLYLEHFFLLPYYDWLERDKSSASVGTVFHTFRFFVHQNIGSVLFPPPTSTIENIIFGTAHQVVYFVLFKNTYAHTQFTQDDATLFVPISCAVVTD